MRKLLNALAATTLLFTAWAQAAPELRVRIIPNCYTVVKGDTMLGYLRPLFDNPWYAGIWQVKPPGG